MNSPRHLSRLLQLASPALPIGAYSYSQGLEAAIDQGWVADEATAGAWIGDQLAFSIARCEAPLWLRMYDAWVLRDFERVDEWCEMFLATRDGRELRAETVQMGYSLARLLETLPEFDPELAAALTARKALPLPAAWSCAAMAWHIPAAEGLVAYMWSWTENQVLAAIKAVPLGQSAGQRLLGTLGSKLPGIAAAAALLPDDGIGNFVPGASLASYAHEVLAGRMFRS